MYMFDLQENPTMLSGVLICTKQDTFIGTMLKGSCTAVGGAGCTKKTVNAVGTGCFSTGS